MASSFIPAFALLLATNATTTATPRQPCGGAAGLAFFRGTFSVNVAHPPRAAFGLFDADGERRWDPTWAPKFLHGDARSAGSVFQTSHHDLAATWLIDAYDAVTDTVRYVVLEPGRTIETIGVAVEPTAGGSRAIVSYETTALGAAARQQVGHFCSTFVHRRGEWQTAIDAVAR